jgi:hypothetical protein
MTASGRVPYSRVVIDPFGEENSMDYRDVGFKVFWTAAAAGLAVVVEVTAGLPNWWVAVLTPVLTAGMVFARQKVSTTS